MPVPLIVLAGAGLLAAYAINQVSTWFENWQQVSVTDAIAEAGRRGDFQTQQNLTVAAAQYGPQESTFDKVIDNAPLIVGGLIVYGLTKK